MIDRGDRHFKRFGVDTFISPIGSGVPSPVVCRAVLKCASLRRRLGHRLQAHGITFIEEPRMQFWNWKGARLKDFSGNNTYLFWAGENGLHPKFLVGRSAALSGKTS